MEKIKGPTKPTGKDVMSSSFQNWEARAEQHADHGGKKWNQSLNDVKGESKSK